MCSSMPSARYPQREMLRRLLDGGKLTADETVAAQEMLDALKAGRIAGLAQRQVTWAEELCRRCGIVVTRVRPVATSKREDQTRRTVAEFDALPRPKKPPGR